MAPSPSSSLTGCAVRQHDGRFQTAKAEETADRYRYPQGIVGQPVRQQQRNIVLPQKLVTIQAAPAADIGIDRYLQRFAGSTLPANQVNDGAAALAADEPGGFGGYFQVSRHRASTVEWGHQRYARAKLRPGATCVTRHSVPFSAKSAISSAFSSSAAGPVLTKS